MISKAVIVVLSFAAVATAVFGLVLQHSEGGNELGKYSFYVASMRLSVGWGAMPWLGPRRSFAFAGFECDYWAPGGVTWVRIPLWAPFILFAAYPTIAFIRGPVRRWRRRRKGCCVKCGYNLTGNVSGVCPECQTRLGA